MHERISVNNMCFPAATLPEMAGYWRELGARRVSFVSHTLLAEGGFDAVRAAVATGDYRVETITHVFMSGRHLDAGEAALREERATLSRVIEMAASLGARSIYMLTGGHGALVWEDAAEIFCAAIRPCIAQARDAGVALLIENATPLYAQVHIAHTLRDTISLAEMAGIGLCIDFFACWAEADQRGLIARAMPRLKLIQLSDYVYGDRSLPARAVPGDGVMQLERTLGWVLAAGYTGAFDLELIGPRIDAEGHVAAVRRAGDRVGGMLQRLGA